VFELLFGVIDLVRCAERLFTCTIRQFGGMCFTAFPIKPSKLLLMVSSSSGYSRNPPSNPELFGQQFLPWLQAGKSAIMGNDEILTDDYVAELLAKDAKDSAIKYSSMGLDAFKQSKYVLLRQNM
jgi:hypothetical protein